MTSEFNSAYHLLAHGLHPCSTQHTIFYLIDILLFILEMLRKRAPPPSRERLKAASTRNLRSMTDSVRLSRGLSKRRTSARAQNLRNSLIMTSPIIWGDANASHAGFSIKGPIASTGSPVSIVTVAVTAANRTRKLLVFARKRNN